MTKSRGRRPNDTPKDVVDFVAYLGCWRFANHREAVERRDPAEYRGLLLQLIKVNRTRHDARGRAETAEAEKMLRRIK
jgi:hypothetical protein